VSTARACAGFEPKLSHALELSRDELDRCHSGRRRHIFIVRVLHRAASTTEARPRLFAWGTEVRAGLPCRSVLRVPRVLAAVARDAGAWGGEVSIRTGNVRPV